MATYLPSDNLRILRKSMLSRKPMHPDKPLEYDPINVDIVHCTYREISWKHGTYYIPCFDTVIGEGFLEKEVAKENANCLECLAAEPPGTLGYKPSIGLDAVETGTHRNR